MFQEVFPYNVSDEFQGAPEGVAEALADNFIAAGGYSQYYTNNINDATVWISIARGEWDRRRSRAREFEQEKLAWGRGFFSYENCDLDVYNDYRTDRRNCRIATPGSLIQDEVSFVLGSALRQMELADEYEEWVSQSSVAILNDILNFNGLNNERTRARVDLSDPPVPLEAGSPDTVGGLIISGELPPRVNDIDGLPRRFPSEFDVLVGPDFSGDESRERFKIKLFNSVSDFYDEIPSLDDPVEIRGA